MKSITMSSKSEYVRIELNETDRGYRVTVVHSLFVDAYKSIPFVDPGAASDYYYITIGRLYETGYR